MHKYRHLYYYYYLQFPPSLSHISSLSSSMQTTPNFTFALRIIRSASTPQSCLASRNSWFCENGLALNPTKSDAILFGTHQRLKTMTNLKSFNIAGTEISLADHVKIRGTILDSSLTMDNHTKAVSKSSLYHIRSFRQIRSYPDDSTALPQFLIVSITPANSILFCAWLPIEISFTTATSAECSCSKHRHQMERRRIQDIPLSSRKISRQLVAPLPRYLSLDKKTVN